ncbi:MAG: FAD-binding oxidoreductase [Clostridia bacterium]|nr:FAD-binding oxidoreductase [Clostridia bacterium]
MSKYKGFKPDWENSEPANHSYRSLFKWGNPTTFKQPNEGLYNVIKNTFHMTDDDFKVKKDEGNEVIDIEIPCRLEQKHIDYFINTVGSDNVKTDVYHRLHVSYGQTMIDLLRLRHKKVENIPDAVLQPSNKTQIELIISYCSKEKIPVYCKSGGSTVTRGMEAMKGGITLDMAVNFNKVIEFNETNQTITVESGISGPLLEQALNEAPEKFNAKRKYTCGHFPQSFEYSGVGGWVVTRGAGQNSSYYGKIEDMVVAQEYATPVGVIKTGEFPREATGPDIDQIMMGSEGAFGILTHVTLKVFRYMPKNHLYYSYVFPSWDNAQAAAREITQGEFGIPSVFRLSDPEETDVMLKLYHVEGTVLDKFMSARGFRENERCLFLGFTDGEQGFVRNMRRKMHKICKKNGAMSLTGYPAKEWEKGRFKDPYMRDALMDYGILIDTMECAVSWKTMPDVHRKMREYCKARKETICMTHMSHVYPQGANLYFIFIARMDTEEYLEYQKGILDHFVKCGAAISHHHGIGKAFGPWLEHSIGENNMAVIHALKNHFDKDNIMNPGGTLGLDVEKREKNKVI